MKTLLITHVFPPRTGGSGRWFWEIYRRLPRGEFVVAAGQHPNQEAFDRTHDLNVVRLPLDFPSWSLLNPRGLVRYARRMRRLSRLVKAQKVTAAHCARTVPEGVLALALHWRYGLPFLCYAHGEELNIAGSSRELSWLFRQVVRRAAFLIANSRNTERLLRDNWAVPPEKIRVLHPGVDTRQFVPAERDPDLRRQLGWDGRTVVLTVGRLQRRKGHDWLIEALPAVQQAVPEVLYAIVGDGEERDRLTELARQFEVADRVQFLGEVPDAQLVRCYQQCDLFVLPNRQIGQDIEGFGMVLVEAQACGRPVVAGASGGTAETMQVPQTGRLVCCDGPEELARLLCELLPQRQLLDRMGAAARSWVEDNFDWSVLSRRAAGLFAELDPGVGGPATRLPATVNVDGLPEAGPVSQR